MKVLITGASSGIGRDLARILADKYDKMVLVARNEKALAELKNELEQKYNIDIKIVAMDLSAINNCIQLHKENPNVDLLINNAGFGDCGYFVDTNIDKEINMINTNICAYHILTKKYLQDMKKKNKGQILNVASIAGFMPGPLMATYYSTKAYILRLSESIREELRREKSNVKISVLCPGPVNTNFNNVANVKFSLKGISSYEVAKYALNNLNKFYIVPGFWIKLSRIIIKFLPTALVVRLIFKIQHKKIYKEEE